MPRKGKSRSQSAVEFVSTYSFVFLIIAIIIFLLFTFSSIPTKVLPSQCTAFGGFSCVDVVYTGIGSNSQLSVSLTDTQPGVINISTFNARIGGVTAIGTCTPNTLLPGNATTCTATFPFMAAAGNVYTSVFNISANYCANGANNVSNRACKAGSSFTYAGSLTTQAQAQITTSLSSTSTTSTSSTSTSTSTSTTSTSSTSTTSTTSTSTTTTIYITWTASSCGQTYVWTNWSLSSGSTWTGTANSATRCAPNGGCAVFTLSGSTWIGSSCSGAFCSAWTLSGSTWTGSSCNRGAPYEVWTQSGSTWTGSSSAPYTQSTAWTQSGSTWTGSYPYSLFCQVWTTSGTGTGTFYPFIMEAVYTTC